MNEMPALKPCPRCGGPARPLLGYILLLDENGNRPEYDEDARIWFGACVYCPKCRCEIERKKISTGQHSGEWHEQIRREAVDAWNTRVKGEDNA